MDTVWIQIFVLTFAECVAPVGKSVCQPQQFELEFLTRRDCEVAMQQLVDVKDQLDYVIVDRNKTQCAAAARQSETVAEPEVSQQAAATENAASSASTDARRSAVNSEHESRLDQLRSCEQTNDVAPCKIGDIIVEEATGDSVEVWRRD